MQKLWNILLYPTRFYEKLTDNKVTLIAGILLIGLIDFFLPDIQEINKLYFTGKPVSDIQFNIVIACLMVVLLGVIDTVFMCIPLFDIFKYFKKKEGQPHQATPIKIIKVYIMSHFLIVPVNILLYYTVFRHVNINSNTLMIFLSAFILFVITVWASAILTRGINTLFSFGPLFKRFAFIIVFTWNYLFGTVFSMQIANWLFKIFK